MFYSLSKVINFFLDPSFCLFLMVLFLVQKLIKKKPIEKLVWIILGYCFLVMSPLVYWPISLLEKAYPVPTTITAENVMVLGGGVTNLEVKNGTYLMHGLAFSRPFSAICLSRKYPIKKLIISGSNPDIPAEGLLNEAETITRMARELGIAPENIYQSAPSLNTHQEAQNIKEYVEKNQIKQLVLVTSALHMPRSVAVFKKLGIEVIPYPVGHILNATKGPWDYGLDHFGYWHQVIHEVVGLIAYKILGYI